MLTITRNTVLLMFFLFSCTGIFAQEDCGNGIDDDGDGLVDCLDPDCTGGTVPTGAFFNTATNGLGSTLPGGSNDLNWTVSTTGLVGPYSPAMVMNASSIPGSYVISPWPDCGWISFNPTGMHSDNIDHYYKIQFMLPCMNSCGQSYSDPGVFCLYMQFYADNSVDAVYINGILQTGIPGVPSSDPYYSTGFVFGHDINMSLCQDWHPGLNELVIKVSSGPSWTGFLAQNSTTSPPVTGDPTITGPTGTDSTTSFCSTEAPYDFSAVSPGGTWSATCGSCINSSTGMFDPSVAGPGTYTITYSLASPCPAADSIIVMVSAPADPTILTPTTSVCSNAPAFTMTASESGGTWSATCGSCINATTGQFNPSAAVPGNFIVTYDIAGCALSDTSLVQVIAANNATIASPLSPDTVCLDGSTVNCTPVSPGGTWSTSCDSCLSAGGTFDPALAGAGSFEIIYTFGGFCPDADTIAIDVLPVPDASILPVSPVCTGTQPFYLSAATPGGNWWGIGTSPAGLFDPAAAGAGTHMITYGVGVSCPQTSSLTIEVYEVQLNVLSVVNSCVNENSGSITATATSGLPVDFVLNIPEIAVNTTGVFSNLSDGNYVVIAIDSIGCSDTMTVVIDHFPAVTAGVSAPDTVCAGALITVTASGGIHYTWLPEGIFGSVSENTVSFAAASGTTDITLVAEANGCTDTAQTDLFAFPVLQIDAGPDQVYDIGPGPLLNPLIPGYGSVYWSPATGLNCNTCLQPEATPESTTVYYLYFTYGNGCTAWDSVTVTVTPSIYVPNAFTPNGDGLNEVFIPVARNLAEYHLTVFDRWGTIVFSTDDTRTAWDGKHNDQLLKEDVYVWTIRYQSQLEPGITKEMKGHVALLK